MVAYAYVQTSIGSEHFSQTDEDSPLLNCDMDTMKVVSCAADTAFSDSVINEFTIHLTSFSFFVSHVFVFLISLESFSRQWVLLRGRGGGCRSVAA